MTNGPGKSDRPAVPEKSPNKAGQPVAEGMEGKGLAKGNLPQQNASRTPSTSNSRPSRPRSTRCARSCGSSGRERRPTEEFNRVARTSPKIASCSSSFVFPPNGFR